MSTQMPRPPRGWTRHLEGWQPALLSVLIAGVTAVLVVPRGVEPGDVPLPVVDARSLAELRRVDDALAARAESEPLDADIRALGSAIRAYGRADAERDEVGIWDSRRKIAQVLPAALAAGEEGVLRLRAFQLRSFLRQVRHWEITGEESPALIGLGGGFVAMLRRNAWCEEGATKKRRRVLLSDAVMRALFKRRWNEITGIQRAAFESALDEQRALFGFLMAHPIAAGMEGEPAKTTPNSPYADAYVLKKLEELAVLDPAYPAAYARGILLYRLGRFSGAADAFQRHLEASPDGPFTLRAQNYLRASLTRAAEP